MDSFDSQLFTAAHSGDVAGVRACLAAGADVNAQNEYGWAAAHRAAFSGHTECMATLIAGGADVNICTTDEQQSPLHFAASQPGCVKLLLAAGADPLAATAFGGWTPLHCATFDRDCHVAVIPLLLQAEPAAALVRDDDNHTPLTLAIRYDSLDTACCLLEQGPLPPAGEVLAALARAGARMRPLFTALISRQPLTVEEWGWVPFPCPGLGAALPAVLARSAQEAALLVKRLPHADRQRLHTAALCLMIAQRQAGTQLPAPLVGQVLALAAA